jgi:hypothetical protein
MFSILSLLDEIQSRGQKCDHLQRLRKEVGKVIKLNKSE